MVRTFESSARRTCAVDFRNNTGLRLYPDLTHNKLSQYEVRDWDQAFALTEGREAVNPRPVEYARYSGTVPAIATASFLIRMAYTMM